MGLTLHPHGLLAAAPTCSQYMRAPPHKPTRPSPNAALVLELMEPLQLAQGALRPLDAASAAIAAAVAAAAAAVLLAAGCRAAAGAAAAAHLVEKLGCLLGVNECKVGTGLPAGKQSKASAYASVAPAQDPPGHRPCLFKGAYCSQPHTPLSHSDAS